MMTARLTLSQLHELISRTLQRAFAQTIWVVAEISELRVAAGGHCYMELVEKDTESNGFAAKARANCWRTTWLGVSRRFQQAVGQPLQAGMTILAEVKVTFHAAYGYALSVADINPEYTLGDLARRRGDILKALEQNGILHDNKHLPLPRPLQRIAVISSPTAAGYGDFCQQLSQSPYAFRLTLFEAAMQGSNVETTIIAALGDIAERQDDFDAVVIIRGGGATTDLQGFESYPLAECVATFPLPVLTGIGHERDDTVIDFVAHTRLKTPTAVAAFLIEAMATEYDLVLSLETQVRDAVLTLLQQHTLRYERVAHRYQVAATQYVGHQRQALQQCHSRLLLAAQRQMEAEHRRHDQASQRISVALLRRMEQEKSRLLLAERTLRMAGHERILALGYSLTTDREGHVIKSPHDIASGTPIRTHLKSGVIDSITL